MKIFYTALIMASIESCVSGGLCEYKDIKFKVTIVAIKKETHRSTYEREAVSEPTYEVKLVSNIHDDDLKYKNDTLYLEGMTRHKITEAFLTKHQLMVGSVLEGTANLITSGSCSPGKFYFNDPTLNEKEK